MSDPKYRFKSDPDSSYVDYVAASELPDYIRAKLQKGLNTGRLPEYWTFLSKQLDKALLPSETDAAVREIMKGAHLG
jgi:hypothetical protein